MSGCDPFRIEAWLEGELAASEASDVAAHLGACLTCARELGALRRERALFTRREVAPVPPFEQVLFAARVQRPRRARRAAPAWVAAVGLAAAVLLSFHVARAPVPMAAGGACWLSDGEDAPSAELAEATEDARFGACLVASPVTHPRCF